MLLQVREGSLQQDTIPKPGGLGWRRAEGGGMTCGCCVAGTRSLMAPAIRGARAGAIRGWVPGS